MEYRVIQGNIAQQSADAHVCSAGTSLMMDTGAVGSALLEVGGEQLHEEALEQGPIERGEVAVTSAYDLDAEYVIHAAAAHYGGEAEEQTIRDATHNSLRTADDLACASLVLPALGCGIAGFSLEKGIRIIHDEIRQFESSTLSDIRIIGYTDEEYRTIADVARALQ